MSLTRALKSFPVEKCTDDMWLIGLKNVDKFKRRLLAMSGGAAYNTVETHVDTENFNIVTQNKMLTPGCVKDMFYEECGVIIIQGEVEEVSTDRIRELDHLDRETMSWFVWESTHGLHLSDICEFDPRDETLPGCSRAVFHDSVYCFC